MEEELLDALLDAGMEDASWADAVSLSTMVADDSSIVSLSTLTDSEIWTEEDQAQLERILGDGDSAAAADLDTPPPLSGPAADAADTVVEGRANQLAQQNPTIRAIFQNARQYAADLGEGITQRWNALPKPARIIFKNLGMVGGMFAITLGIQRAMAQKAHASGQRVALTSYLQSVAQRFTALGLPFGDEQRQAAAQGALALPWIDCTA